MPSRVIKTQSDFDALGRLLSGLQWPITVEWRKGADRSLQANALMWQWAGEYAAQLGDRTAKEVQHQWKLVHGVPILLSENEGFRDFANRALKPLTYAERLAAMEYVPVTSIMTVPQMRALMDAVQREAVENGIRLTQPEEA